MDAVEDGPPEAAVSPVPLPAPTLVGPRGAIRRSLLIWGWGQLATGDRRGWLLAPLEAAALAAIWFIALPYASGTAAGIVFVAIAAFVALWAAQALHAERRARRRLAPFVAPGSVPHGAAVELLWLAPIVVAGGTAFWAMAGAGGSPDDVVAEYVATWRADQAADAAALFAVPPGADAVRTAWQHQAPRLDNALIAAAAQAGPDGGIDAAAPWASVRWQDAASVAAVVGNAAGEGAPASTTVVAGVIVREQPERDTFLGLVPTRTVRLVPLAGLGTVTLRTVQLPPPIDGAPPVVVWRIGSVDLLEEHLGS